MMKELLAISKMSTDLSSRARKWLTLGLIILGVCVVIYLIVILIKKHHSPSPHPPSPPSPSPAPTPSKDCGDGHPCNISSGNYCCIGGKCVAAASGDPCKNAGSQPCGSVKDACGRACPGGKCDGDKTCGTSGKCADCMAMYGNGFAKPPTGDPAFTQWLIQNVNSVPENTKWDENKGLTMDGGTTWSEAVCPYGMQLVKENDTYNCVDISSPKTCQTGQTSVRGQCIDSSGEAVVTITSQGPRIYMTWFGMPGVAKTNEKAAQDTCKLLLAFVKATRDKAGSSEYPGSGIQGLSFPLLFPDQNNQPYQPAAKVLSTGPTYATSKQDVNTYYINVAEWLIDAFLLQALKDGTSPGFLLNPNFHYPTSFVLFPQGGDGVGYDGKQTASYLPGCVGWDASFTGALPTANSDAGIKKWLDQSKGAGPAAAGLDDPTNKLSCIGWSAWMEWMRIYIVQSPKLASIKDINTKIWFHWDKEWCGCGDLNDYLYLIRSSDMWRNTIISLPSGETMTGAPPYEPHSSTASSKSCGQLPTTPSSCYASAVGSPELYWGIGIQHPCTGGPGQYNYLPKTCTSWSTRRALQDNPSAYYNLVMGNPDTGTGGSDHCAAWGGHGAFEFTAQHVNPDPLKWGVGNSPTLNDKAMYGDNIWPSFSIENLSMCDRNDPSCTSLQRQVAKDEKYTFGEHSTGCPATFMRGDAEDKDVSSLEAKPCGTFDGFSFWSWKGFNGWLNKYHNETGAQNLIIYEASFTPYSWLLEVLGASTLASYAGDQPRLVPLPQPDPIPNACKTSKDCSEGMVCENGVCQVNVACTSCGKDAVTSLTCVGQKDSHGDTCSCTDALANVLTDTATYNACAKDPKVDCGDPNSTCATQGKAAIAALNKLDTTGVCKNAKWGGYWECNKDSMQYHN